MVGIIVSWWLKIPEIEFSLDMGYEPLDVTKKMWRCDQDGFYVIVSWLYIPRICSSPKFTSFRSLSRWKLLFVMAPHSSILAWKIPWTEEPGGLQSMGLLRVGHNWATSLSLSCIGEGNGNPLQCSCLENPRHGGAWWAAVYGVAQSWTRLKRLSSSSSIKDN